jgi:hypothetical protein
MDPLITTTGFSPRRLAGSPVLASEILPASVPARSSRESASRRVLITARTGFARKRLRVRYSGSIKRRIRVTFPFLVT